MILNDVVIINNLTKVIANNYKGYIFALSR